MRYRIDLSRLEPGAWQARIFLLPSPGVMVHHCGAPSWVPLDELDGTLGEVLAEAKMAVREDMRKRAKGANA